MKPQTYTTLCDIAAAAIDANKIHQLKASLTAIDDWQSVAEQAEIHGLSVMFGKLASDTDLGIPRNLGLQLKALTLRHQKALAARETVLADVIDVFAQNAIAFALLKGAALSPLLYEPSWLRPMRDIDILVAKDKAQQAQNLLRTIGFTNEDFNPGYLYEHHHLPNSTRTQDGFKISLEVHHDALSGDVADSITLENLIDPLQPFDLAGRRAYALGHYDMLRHLCYHTFEPADTIKLGSIVDLIHYANTFHSEIDWPTLAHTQPFISNTLRCVHALVPLPDPLRETLGDLPENWHPEGIGHGFAPLSKIMNLTRYRDRFRALFVPSAWWMHVYYAIPPKQPLFYARVFRHPMRLAKWLLRRYQANRKSKQNQRSD